MRKAGRALIALFVLAILLIVVPPVWRTAWKFYGAMRQPSAAASDAQGATAYVVARDRPLEFRLSGHADLVRLRVHALLPQIDEFGGAASTAFALGIELLDSNDNPLNEQVYHVRSTVGRYLDAETGELFALNLVDDPAFAVAGINLIPLNLSAWPSAQVVRVTLAEADAEIFEVGLRLYEPEAIPEHSIERFWQRLSEQQRARLAEGNVYPYNLLTPAERAAVLSQRWRPVGPVGVQDQDYRVRSLFAREGRAGAFISYALPMVGLRVDRDHPIDLPVTESGRYFIRANLDLAPQESDAAPAQLQVEVADSEGTQAIQIGVPATTVARALLLQPGKLRLTSDKPVRVVLLRSLAAAVAAPLPRKIETRTYRMRAGSALSYRTGSETETVALRLDLRRPFDRIDGSAPLTVRGEYRDTSGALIGGDSFELPPSAPMIDLRTDDPAVLLSPAAQVTLTLPPGVAQVTLSAPQDAYVAAFSRLPLTAGAEAPSADVAADEWFGLAPSGWALLIAGGDSLTIEQSSGAFARSGPADAQ